MFGKTDETLVTLDKLQPGVYGVSHGGGIAGELIRHATGSWARTTPADWDQFLITRAWAA